jgi:hypothetical protein
MRCAQRARTSRARALQQPAAADYDVGVTVATLLLRALRSDVLRSGAGRSGVGACVACAFAALVSSSAVAHAWVVPEGAPPSPACPAIPDADDVELSAADRARVDDGEIVVRFLEKGERGALVQAVGYLDAHPAWLFEVATDSELATELADVLKSVDVVDTRPAGKTMRGVADPSALLPSYRYTLAVSYLEDNTGQCWAQIEGDFGKNEGSHSYLWDPEREATLAVFTFELRLKGWLRLIPQSVVMRLSARTLPAYMRGLEAFSERLSREDAARAARVDARWQSLRARLHGDELAGRVWHAHRHGRALSGADARTIAGFRRGVIDAGYQDAGDEDAGNEGEGGRLRSAVVAETP